jgi:acyl-coenzyme A synthetase/AMP-(fatty) acid ligase
MSRQEGLTNNARLAGKLLQSGYGIRRTDRDFELASVSRELIEKFSKRTRAIEQLARDPESLRVVPELPRNATGKIDRRLLLNMISEHEQRDQAFC